MDRRGWMHQLLASAYLRDGVLMTTSNALAGGLFLATHMVVGRALDGVDYALLVALLGLLNVLGVPQATLQLVVARFAADPGAVAGTADGARAQLLRWTVWQVTWVGAAAMMIWLLLLPLSRRLLPGASGIDLALVGLVAWIGLYSPAFSGALQGRRRFRWLAASGVAGALVRVLLALVVGRWLPRVDLVLGVWVMSYAVTLLLAFWPLRGDLLGRRSGAPMASTGRDLVSYTLWMFAGQLIFFGLMNADLILAPRLLAEGELATYGKVAMLCRSVLFLPVPVVLAMFPRAVISGRRRVLLGPLGFCLAVAGVAAVVIWLQPELPLRLMFGVSGREFAELARRYIWAAVPLTLDLVLVHYLWARRAKWVALALGPIVGLYGFALISLGQLTVLDLPLLLGAAAGLAFGGLLVAALRSAPR